MQFDNLKQLLTQVCPRGGVMCPVSKYMCQNTL